MYLMFSTVLGGVGLFLLGMTMMTDGMRLAAGPTLSNILQSATRSRWSALASGMGVTALVQSSSAITIASIGFVNAGLLSLTGAIWVLLGANVGSTMTGWIVAILGLKLKIDLLAMPLIGIGVFMRLIGNGKQSGAMGQAITGFGLLFLGIAMLQTGFADLTTHIALPQGDSLTTILLSTLMGMALTILMQSSSASTVVALTAAQGGLIGIEAAAAVVIGANVATSFKAILAALGATPNARRVAAAHVFFNVLTAIVALALLPFLIDGIQWVRGLGGSDFDPAITLAIFNTLFNVMGVMLIWPMSDYLINKLKGMFELKQHDIGRPRYLDETALPVPTLAAQALSREIMRMMRFAWQCLSQTVKPQQLLPSENTLLQSLAGLLLASETFVSGMNRSAMDAQTASRLAHLLRIRRYLENVQDLMLEVLKRPNVELVNDDMRSAFQAFEDAVLDVVRQFEPLLVNELEGSNVDFVGVKNYTDEAYESLKSATLTAGALGLLTIQAMESGLARFSAQRRVIQQLMKAHNWLEKDFIDQAKLKPESDVELGQ
jgi:phosphate:Na+ symporter